MDKCREDRPGYSSITEMLLVSVNTQTFISLLMDGFVFPQDFECI